MTRSLSAALTPLRDTLDLLLAIAAPVAPRAVPLAAARSRIAAGDVLAPRGLPAAPVALRDGFAVEAARLGGASPYAPVPLPGPPPWVEAGAGLPAGADAVLPAEGLEGRSAVADVAAREGIRGPGEELEPGDRLLVAGACIGPRHLLALAAVGLQVVEIRVPRLRLVATGAPEPDALSPMLAALIEARGAAVDIVAAPDQPEAIADAILGGEADAVLVLGGTGFGRTDRSAEGLERAGRLLAHGIALRPGESAGIGEAGGRPVLLLPGRPEAALAADLTLGRPLVAQLAGARETPPLPALLMRKIASSIGLSEVVYVRRCRDGVEPLGGAELPLRRLIEADGAVVVAPEREGYPEGAQVEVVTL